MWEVRRRDGAAERGQRAAAARGLCRRWRGRLAWMAAGRLPSGTGHTRSMSHPICLRRERYAAKCETLSCLVCVVRCGVVAVWGPLAMQAAPQGCCQTAHGPTVIAGQANPAANHSPTYPCRNTSSSAPARCTLLATRLQTTSRPTHSPVYPPPPPSKLTVSAWPAACPAPAGSCRRECR